MNIETENLSDGWILGLTEEGKTLFIPKKQPFAPERIEQRHKVVFPAKQVLQLVKDGVLTFQNILTFREWKRLVLPYLGKGDKEFDEFYMKITPAFALAVDLENKVVMLGEGRLIGENGKPIEGPGVMGIVKNTHEGQIYTEPDINHLIQFLDMDRDPLSIKLGFAEIPQYIKSATYFFSPLHFGFTCPSLNEDRVVMNCAQNASVIMVRRK